jgi:hypothetical protein
MEAPPLKKKASHSSLSPSSSASLSFDDRSLNGHASGKLIPYYLPPSNLLSAVRLYSWFSRAATILDIYCLANGLSSLSSFERWPWILMLCVACMF